MIINEYENNNLKFIELDNGELKIKLCNLGASVFSIYFDNQIMTMTPKNTNDFWNSNLYHGKTIGRTSNRIQGNIVQVNNEKFLLLNNEGPNTLHGGTDGLSSKLFSYTIKQSFNETKVIFKYTSKDKESGFPGTLKVKIIYTFYEKKPVFIIKFDAVALKPTFCNLTNHTFFTLGEKCLDNISLKLKSNIYLKCDANDLLPLERAEINKELDFRKFKKVMKDIDKLRYGKANGYDHNFYIDNKSKNPKIVLRSPYYLLKLKSNFECCQIYTDNFTNEGIEWIGLGNTTNRSIAIEPQDDFLNRKILNTNEKYSRYIKYEFSKR